MRNAIIAILALAISSVAVRAAPTAAPATAPASDLDKKVAEYKAALDAALAVSRPLRDKYDKELVKVEEAFNASAEGIALRQAYLKKQAIYDATSARSPNVEKLRADYLAAAEAYHDALKAARNQNPEVVKIKGQWKEAEDLTRIAISRYKEAVKSANAAKETQTK